MTMKKMILFISLVLSVVHLDAQTKYRGIVEGGYSFLQDNKSGCAWRWNSDQDPETCPEPT